VISDSYFCRAKVIDVDHTGDDVLGT